MNPPQNTARRPVVDRTLPRGDTATTIKKAANATAVRALPDVLSDPDADWSDVREALKVQGRGSILAGYEAVAATTTHAGILKALRDARIREVQAQKLARDGGAEAERRKTSLTQASSDDDDDDEDVEDDNRLQTMTMIDAVKRRRADRRSSAVTEATEVTPGSPRAQAQDEAAGRTDPSVNPGVSKRAEATSSAESDALHDLAKAGASEGKPAEARRSTLPPHDSTSRSSGAPTSGNTENDPDEESACPSQYSFSTDSSGALAKAGASLTLTLASGGKPVEARRPTPPPHDSSPKSSDGTTSGDAENDPDAQDSSSGDSSGTRRHLPERRILRTPSGREVTIRVGKDGRKIPERRLPRKSSAKALGSFRGSLRNVLEDQEADMDHLEEDIEALKKEGGVTSSPGPVRGLSFRKNSMRSIHAESSNSSLSSGDLSASCQSGLHKESINMMDFGYDPHQKRNPSESASSAAASNRDDLSNLVDSDGFLAWGVSVNSDGFLAWECASSSDPSKLDHKSQSGSHPSNESKESDSIESNLGEATRAGSGSSNNDFSVSGSLDSDGFLGWGTASDAGEATMNSQKSWRIEDYENGQVQRDSSKGPDAVKTLSQKMRRLSLAMAEGLAARRSSSDFAMQTAQLAQEATKTANVKHVLLRACSAPIEAPTGEGATKESTRDAAGTSVFKSYPDDSKGNKEWPSSRGDHHDSRPAILRIVREDSVRIGKLRTEFNVGGDADDNEETAIDKVKMAFWSPQGRRKSA